MIIKKEMHGTTFYIDLNDANIEHRIGQMRTDDYKQNYNQMILGDGLYSPAEIDKLTDQLEALFKSFKESESAQAALFDHLPLKKNN